jgi:purine-binding chemotaxis protein CheW
MEQKVKSEIKQFIIFKLGDEEYGVDTQKVKSIQEMMTIIRVPRTPSFIKGVINLRGDIIPVMDLRDRFNMPSVDATDETRIIILRLGESSMGVVVDSATETLQLSEDAIENITDFINDLSVDYVIGVGKINNRVVTLLNFEKLVKVR